MRREDRIALAPKAALRPERFGALVYTYDERRLLFLDESLCTFVTSEGARSVGEIGDSLIADGKLDEAGLARMLLLLEGLRRKGIVRVL